MRSIFAGLTVRGRSFLAAGVVIGALGFGLGQRALLSVGVLLVVLPLLTGLAASRARYRIRCTRQLLPARVAAGQRAQARIRLENISRLPTGLLLAEDEVPYPLGPRPRFVLDRIEQGGSRQLSYHLASDSRGRYPIGPFRVRVADVFGLVELGRSFAPLSTLVVTPAITVLPPPPPPGSWRGEGEAGATTATAAGEDDAVPRPYRDGDELRRVHWRSTARQGELMVRREEQHWRDRAVVFLDSRATAHAGRGPGSSFEAAVSAAASAGVCLARERMDCQFVTDTGPATMPGRFEDVLLDTLAVIQPSRMSSLTSAGAQLRSRPGGLLIAVLGQLSAADTRQLAAARRGDTPAMALLLDVTSWAAPRRGPQPGGPAAGGQTAGAPGRETATAARILTGAGWRVAVLTAGQPLTAAWRELHSPGGQLFVPPPAASPASPVTASPVTASPVTASPVTASPVTTGPAAPAQPAQPAPPEGAPW
jgi:uncharacterized protein (DUF58 family)